jgi:hypothetical protein
MSASNQKTLGSSKLTDLHFHRMIAVVIQQRDGIPRERLTVEG